MESIIFYPITEDLLFICHADDYPAKTDKEKLIKSLEKEQKHLVPEEIHEIQPVVIDGGLLLYSVLEVVSKIKSNGWLARRFHRYANMYVCSSLHVLFDKYEDKSLKTTEKERMYRDHQVFVFTGPQQYPPLHSSKLSTVAYMFKNELAKSMQIEW